MKIIKNIDTVPHTYAGQEIAAEDQYTIQALEELKMSIDDSLLSDIASGKAVINNGSVDLSGISVQIDFLKSNMAKEVVTQFEKRDKTLKAAHAEGEVQSDGSAVALLKIPGTLGSEDGRWISSGAAFFNVHTPGDKVVGIYFTDEDNVLGQGVGYIVGSYTDDDAGDNRGWVILPNGWLRVEAIGGYGFAPAGFYIKIVGFKAGENPTGKFYCNFEWGKVD